MATITDVEFLEQIKTRLSITGTFHDALLNGYIKDVKDYLKRAGTANFILMDDSCLGVVARGVSDLWNFGAGDGKFSPLFYDMATQLALNASGHTDEDYDAKIPYVARITLYADKWINNVQSVVIEGITIANAEYIKACYSTACEYEESGVDVVAEGNNLLTFTCQRVPSIDLFVNVMVFPIVKGGQS